MNTGVTQNYVLWLAIDKRGAVMIKTDVMRARSCSAAKVIPRDVVGYRSPG